MLFVYDKENWHYPVEMKFADKEIAITDLSVDHSNNPSFIDNKELFIWHKQKWAKHNACHTGVCPGTDQSEFYSTSCETNKVWVYHRQNKTKAFLEGPETSYIASGAGILYAVGLKDKKLYRYTKVDKKWSTMGLENVLKVASGPRGSIFAIIEGNTIVKYNKVTQSWKPFGNRHDAFKVTVDGEAHVYLQDRDNNVWKTKTSESIDNKIIECKKKAKVGAD